MFRKEILNKKVKKLFRFKESKKLFFYHVNRCYLNSKTSSKIKNVFKNRLIELARLKFIYGLRKRKDVRKYLALSSNYKFYDSGRLLSLLNRRLDVLLFKLGFFVSLAQAKQVISHKKVRLNGKTVSRSNILVKRGDVITFEKQTHPSLKNNIQKKIESRNSLFRFSNIEVSYRIFTVIVLQDFMSLNDLILHERQLINYGLCKNIKNN